MQINRLFEMIHILLNKEIVTAGELAERFEVSQRTIYRDVEMLSSAGVPIYMQKGKGGGIGLLPEYALNKTVLSEEEKSEILAALNDFSAVNPNSSAALSKFSALFGTNAEDWVEIDYSDWNLAKQTQFDLLKQAVINRIAIHFDYFDSDGDYSFQEAEPLTLWFKSRAWYLRAFCENKQDFRIFKLNRMKNIALTDRHFEAKIMFDFDNDEDVPPLMTEVKIKFEASQNYRVYDDFEDEEIVRNPDGSFIVTFQAPIDNWFYNYLLSFGCWAEVLAPESVRNNIKKIFRIGLENYS